MKLQGTVKTVLRLDEDEVVLDAHEEAAPVRRMCFTQLQLARARRVLSGMERPEYWVCAFDAGIVELLHHEGSVVVAVENDVRVGIGAKVIGRAEVDFRFVERLVEGFEGLRGKGGGEAESCGDGDGRWKAGTHGRRIAQTFVARLEKAIQSFAALHSGLRQSGSAWGAVVFPGLRPGLVCVAPLALGWWSCGYLREFGTARP